MSSEIENRIRSLVRSGIFDHRRIVLFGANNASKQMKECLEQHQYDVEAVIDNDRRKWNQCPFGVRVSSPEAYLGEFDSQFIILIASQYYREMAAQLEQMGYKEGIHIVIVQKLYDKYDTSPEVFRRAAETIRKGNDIYEGIIAKYPEILKAQSGRLYICPYVGNGDIYLIGQFLEEHRKMFEIEHCAITVVGAVCEKIGKMFRWTNIEPLTQAESDSLLAYVRFAGLQESKAIVLNDCYQQVVNRRLRGYKGVDFRVMFQKVVFGLEDKQELVCHESEIGKDEIIQFAQANEMLPGNTVIIAPYANTVSGISLDTWERIAREFEKKGYRVFTNCQQETQVIQGTRRLFAPFAYMKQLVEYAGVFVGIRSGLCDIIAPARAKKIILYPAGRLFGACSAYDYFSLNKMGYCKDAAEIECCGNDSEEAIAYIRGISREPMTGAN